MRGRTIASFSLVLAVLLLWPAPPSTADEAGTRLPFISFYTMVIDEPHHRVYVDGGPGTTGLAVLDFEGKQVAEDELPNPAGMVLIGDELFVLLSDAGTIEVIDVSGTELPLSRALEVPGFTAYGDMTFVDGHLWLEATRDFNEVLVEVDPRTGPTGGVLWLPQAPPLDDARFASHAAVGSELAMFAADVTPMSIVSYHVGKGQPSDLRVIQEVGTVNAGADASITEDGDVLVAADVPGSNDARSQPEGFREFDRTTGTLLRTYDTGVTFGAAFDAGVLRPDAVDVTEASGGMVAGGSASDGWQDVWVFRSGLTAPFWTHDLGPSNITTLPGGIAWSADGRSLFVVAGAVPRLGSSSPYEDAARFFVLHPLTDPSSGPAKRKPSSGPPAAGGPARQQVEKARTSLPVGAVRAVLVMGLLLAIGITRQWWSAWRRWPAAMARTLERTRRQLGPVLESGETVAMVSAANGGGSDGARTAIELGALVAALFVVPGPVASLSGGVATLGAVLIIECFALSVVFRMVLKPRRMVLTDRRLLVCEARPFSDRPGSLLVSDGLGSEHPADVSRRGAVIELSLFGDGGPSRIWMVGLRRSRAAGLANAIEDRHPRRRPSKTSPPAADQVTKAVRVGLGPARAGLREEDVAVGGEHASSEAVRSSHDQTAAALLALAGLLALVSYLLGWAHLTFPKTSASLVTVKVGHSPAALWTGGLLFLGAARTRSMKRARERPRRRSLATLAPALILAGYAIFDLGSERSRAISILAKNTARHLGLPLARVQANVDDQVVRGWVRFSFSAGIFLAFLAAGLAVAAVLVSRAGARDEQAGAASLPSSRSSFLQPGEIIVDTVGAWRGGERASAVTLAATAGAGTAIGFSNSLGPLSPGKGAIAGAIGGGAGAMIGSLIDKRRARKRSDPAGDVRMKVILTLTSERLLLCAAALRQEDRTLVEEIPLEGIADVSVATRKRLGVEVGAAITVGLHDDAEAKTFTVTGSPAPGVRFADALRAAIAGAVPAR